MTDESSGRLVCICVTSPAELNRVSAIVAEVTGKRLRRQQQRYSPSSSQLHQLPWRIHWPDADAGQVKKVRRRLENEGIGFHIIWPDSRAE